MGPFCPKNADVRGRASDGPTSYVMCVLKKLFNESQNEFTMGIWEKSPSFASLVLFIWEYSRSKSVRAMIPPVISRIKQGIRAILVRGIMMIFCTIPDKNKINDEQPQTFEGWNSKCRSPEKLCFILLKFLLKLIENFNFNQLKVH